MPFLFICFFATTVWGQQTSNDHISVQQLQALGQMITNNGKPVAVKFVTAKTKVAQQENNTNKRNKTAVLTQVLGNRVSSSKNSFVYVIEDSKSATVKTRKEASQPMTQSQQRSLSSILGENVVIQDLTPSKKER